jgi:hypothetical protein
LRISKTTIAAITYPEHPVVESRKERAEMIKEREEKKEESGEQISKRKKERLRGEREVTESKTRRGLCSCVVRKGRAPPS